MAQSLTVTPITWNVIGLDSNGPQSGPQHFPVGARVCPRVCPGVGTRVGGRLGPGVHARVGRHDGPCPPGVSACARTRLDLGGTDWPPLELGEPQVALLQLAPEPGQDVVDLVHTVAAEGEGEAQSVDRGPVDRTVGQGASGSPLRLGRSERPTASGRDDGDAGDHEEKEQEQHERHPAIVPCGPPCGDCLP